MRRILIADDNLQNRYMLETLLKSQGIEVVSAENGAIALELARERKPDLIVTDILMPIMDGFTLCREIKKDPQLASVPVVFYTATYTDPRDQELGLGIGAEAYILKPQDPVQLLEQLREILVRVDARRSEAEAQALAPETEFLRRHDAALFRKLEKKMRDLQALNAELHAARDDAERANRAKDVFLAVLSHELRTPLTSILTWAQLLKSGKLQPQSALRAAEAIEKSGWEQKRLVDDLLDMARITAGKLTLERSAVDVRELLEGIVEKHLSEASKKKLELRSEIAPMPSRALLDPLRVGQVLDNLLKNALKFTAPGGRIRVTAALEDACLLIRISDNGIGIEPEARERIFDPFIQQESPTSRAHGGLGIGLAVVKSLVKMMEGDVRAESQGKGQGAVFQVALPFLPASSAPIPAPRRSPPSSVELKGRRMILVDDDAPTLASLSAFLEDRGIAVTACASADSALEAALRDPPEVFVSDIAMPIQDGYALVAKLRTLQEQKRLPRFPVVALTAFADRETRLKALRAGFDEASAKPVDFDQFFAILGALLKGAARQAA